MTDVAGPNPQNAQQHIDVDNESINTSGTDDCSAPQKKMDTELIEDVNLTL
jgi:hypothetical protein